MICYLKESEEQRSSVIFLYDKKDEREPCVLANKVSKKRRSSLV